MGGGRHNDEMIAWPTAEVSFMDPAFATTIVHGLKPEDEGFDEGYQSVPVNWGISSNRKRGFFTLLAEMTGGEAPK